MLLSFVIYGMINEGSLGFRALTLKADIRSRPELRLSVSVCGPGCCGESHITGFTQLVSATFWLIERVESAAEPVDERNHSDWLSS